MDKRFFVAIGLIVVVIGLWGYFKFYDRDRYDDNDYVENISYDVPSKFEKSNYGEYYHYYGDGVSCDFSVEDFSTYSYSDGKKYLERGVSIYLSDEVSEVREVDINGDLWYSFGRKNGGDVSYYYAIVKDGKGYFLEYSIRDHMNGYYDGDKDSFCKDSYDRIIKSVKLKG